MTPERIKTKGMADAEAQLMALATQGVKSEMEMKAPAKNSQKKDAAPEDEGLSSPGQAGRNVKRRFGIAQDDRPEEEPLSKKIGPSVRPTTWLAMRKLEIRLEELGDRTSLNQLTDGGLRTMVNEMNAGLDGKLKPDAYDLAVEAMSLLRSIRKAGTWGPEMGQQIESLEDRLDEL